ncbi:MAG: nuclear transport factor 2 family protein [Desulfosarcinaceae bacterium]|nr:nuclear transport factor 2 family protein [Desulfosarcinaceae bacterium]
MTEQKPNKEIVAEFFAAFGRRDLEAVASFFAEDIVYTVVGDPDGTPPLDPESKQAIPWIGTYHGPAGAREFIAHLQRNIEVIGFGPQEVIGDGDVIAVFGSFSYRAVSTGRRFDSDYVIRIRLKDGKFSEYSFYENTYAVAAAFRTKGHWVQVFDGTEVKVPAA